MKTTRCAAVLGMLILVLAGQAFAQEPRQQFEGFNLEGYTDGGERDWNVTGDTADIQGETIAITNVDANKFGDQEMNLKAQRGIVDKATGNIHLNKDVVITAKTGEQLKTDSLDWQKDADLVSTEDEVVLTGEGMQATGKGLTAKPGLRKAQLNQDVSVTMNTEPEKKEKGRKVTITSDGPMEIDQANNLAVFKDNVVAVQEDQTLKSDKMEIYIDPDTKKVNQIVCVGNVSIQQGENITYSQRAVFRPEEQKLILTGRPKLIMETEGSGTSIFGD